MKDIKIIEVNENDVLIFKFHSMELGKQELTPIAEDFMDMTGCNVIVLDNQYDLETILKHRGR